MVNNAEIVIPHGAGIPKPGDKGWQARGSTPRAWTPLRTSYLQTDDTQH